MPRVRQFGTAGLDEMHATAADASGMFAVGRSEGALPGQGFFGGSDAVVRKYGPSGAELWTREFGTTGNDIALGVATGPGGAVYVAGYVAGPISGQSYAGGSYDVFVRKYDGNGTELWTREFGTSQSDWANGIAVDAAGNAYVVGVANAALPGQSWSGADDAFVCKYDAAGNVLWTNQFGTTLGDSAMAVTVDPLGGVDVAGPIEP